MPAHCYTFLMFENIEKTNEGIGIKGVSYYKII